MPAGHVAGLFAGIGGFEKGLASAGFEVDLLCDAWEHAASTLARRFPGVSIVGDIVELKALPAVEIVTAGFPCTDLSQVGRVAGIDGNESGLVREVFRLVDSASPRWLVLENVPNMLALHGGQAMAFITGWLESQGWNWAYRTVDSQSSGVAQRRRRVIVVASKMEDPRQVLFADEAGPSMRRVDSPSAYGFYWTEGNRGVGWAPDAVPTLKGGSKLGIPSPPAVWLPQERPGKAIVRPDIRAAERLQGFPAGWTDHVEREGHRWKLVGNAVTVNVAKWLGQRLHEPGEPVEVETKPLADVKRWPAAAAGIVGRREAWFLSEVPLRKRRQRLTDVLRINGMHPLSRTATAGFAKRLSASKLRAGGDEFRSALSDHVAEMS
ncbi:DNA cytosine methyltransferase [Kribbella sp. NBC_00359]|uniref:DNA cytosine methyltransferase n=1 Tax=Kribbella sp. NBC_00359 TaxID=2975966 RepID=UPI002E1F7871